MSLILDHINGVPTDNRLENLQIVCPNCAATLETHCGRKNRIDREPRRVCTAPLSSFRSIRRTATARSGAGPTARARTRHGRSDGRCRDRPMRSLLSDVQTMSFVAVGRKYGVSDNAVRKWLRYYEREE